MTNLTWMNSRQYMEKISCFQRCSKIYPSIWLYYQSCKSYHFPFRKRFDQSLIKPKNLDHLHKSKNTVRGTLNRHAISYTLQELFWRAQKIGFLLDQPTKLVQVSLASIGFNTCHLIGSSFVTEEKKYYAVLH